MIMKGQKISDRYQIIKAIGEGGMANVYLAYDTILDRNVAVKVLRGDFIVDVEEGSNMDPRDLLTTASVPGRIVIGSCDPFTGTGDVVMSVKEAIDKSAHAQLETDKVIIASAMMYNLPEDTLTANGQKIKTEML